MDDNECRTVIPAARAAAGMPPEEALAEIEKAIEAFGGNLKERLGTKGEW